MVVTAIRPGQRRVILRRWNELTRFMQILCYTPWAKNGRPQSLVMIGDPGHGKTELLERFRLNPQLAYRSDATYRTVLRVLRLAERGAVTHLVLPELQKIIARRHHIAASTLTFIMEAMEEGIHELGFGPVTYDFHGTRLGLFAATTVRSVRQNPYMIRDLAMDSRAYFVDARGTPGELEEIERRIQYGDESALRPIRCRFPRERITVTVSPRILGELRGWVREMHTRGARVYGVRTFNRFRYTLLGVALRHGRARVTMDDCDELYSFRRLWLVPPELPDDDEPQTSGNGAGD